MSGRAVITGIGVLAPTGASAAGHFSAVAAGTGALGRISSFDPSGYPATLAGEVTEFDPEQVPGRLRVQTDRWTWMGFAAAEQALADAALDLSELDPYSASVVLASSSGGNVFGQRELQRLWSHPERTVGAYQSIAWFYAATVGQLSIRHQAKGPSNVLVSESAGGLDSLAHAARLVRRGVPVVLAGGLEAPLSPYALSCQLRSGRLSTRDDPDRAYLPFDTDAAGYVPGEGGAVLVVEDLDHARARGAPLIYGEVRGWAATHDGTPSGPGRGGSPEQYARSMRLALDRAGRPPEAVDAVVPDALGVPECDRAEAAAIRSVFGSRDVPVTSQKSLTGRLYQGGAALDAATALLAMRERTLPACAGVREPAEGCDLNFVPATTRAELDTVLLGARGFDGYNSALVLCGHDGATTENGGGR
ncbi:beta-ketoacyl synthase N-terminal-like domain-containing protein [Saccharomonospora saliphila]|uniref:beta-ketoacyl synthase N-terminal-like domain-containing protein n=1 Tax=Saccharomonospora saliphila TaxID=369829 RepID=UPI00035D30E6|nr:beta-ketoacyl synthase N-terminal-like domain-containing protein [Saccharomonospora saliphila]